MGGTGRLQIIPAPDFAECDAADEEKAGCLLAEVFVNKIAEWVQPEPDAENAVFFLADDDLLRVAEKCASCCLAEAACLLLAGRDGAPPAD